MPFTICRNRVEQMADGGFAHPPSAIRHPKCHRVGPSWDRRGGCASRKYRRTHPLKAQTGLSVSTDHPVRALLAFDGLATPPVSGGAYAIPTRFPYFAMVLLVLLLSSCRQQMADQPRYDTYE